MDVLVVHNRYRSEQPSGENAVVDREVAALTAAGHRVMVFARHSDDIAAMSAPAKAMVVARVPWNRAVRTELAGVLRAERPDVVHVHNTFPLLSPSVLASCVDEQVPVVATLHNYAMICPPGTLYRDGRTCMSCVDSGPLTAVRHGCYRGSRLATVPVAVSTRVNRKRWWSDVARMFCISAAQREILVGAGMPADRLVVKHNFVPDSGVRRRGSGEHILYLGRITAEKGIPTLLAAWDELATAGGIGAPLVLAGAGPLSGAVTRWADGRDDVRFVGLRDREECHRLLADAAAVVAPSAWPEAFGLVVVEAAAAGVPAVASGHGAFVELVDDGVTGLHHAPDDPASLAKCLRGVVEDTARNVRMGAAARRRYEREFTEEVGVSRLLAGYRAAIGVTPPEGSRSR